MYESNLTSRLKDMTTFQTDTQNKLNALNPTTLVGNDYIFSPKIGGGYAYFTNRDGSYSVEIDPQHAAGDKTLDKCLFCIRKMAILLLLWVLILREMVCLMVM